MQSISLTVSEKTEKNYPLEVVNLKSNSNLPKISSRNSLQNNISNNNINISLPNKKYVMFKPSRKLDDLLEKAKQIKNITNSISYEPIILKDNALYAEPNKSNHLNKINSIRLTKPINSIKEIKQIKQINSNSIDSINSKINTINNINNFKSLDYNLNDKEIELSLANELIRRINKDKDKNIAIENLNKELKFNYISISEYNTQSRKSLKKISIKSVKSVKSKVSNKSNKSIRSNTSNRSNRSNKSKNVDKVSFLKEDENKINTKESSSKIERKAKHVSINEDANLEYLNSPGRSPRVKSKDSCSLLNLNANNFNDWLLQYSNEDLEALEKVTESPKHIRKIGNFETKESSKLSRINKSIELQKQLFSRITSSFHTSPKKTLLEPVDEGEKRYLEYIKTDFQDRKKFMSWGYRNYLEHIRFTSELKLKKVYSTPGKKRGIARAKSLIDIISEEILKNKKTNTQSQIYKKLEHNENIFFGTEGI